LHFCGQAAQGGRGAVLNINGGHVKVAIKIEGSSDGTCAVIP